ncbi:hypothetical protein M0051_07755 [Marinifilum sp. D714]|nr:hypothetical protein [Marinifilum sp. D714]
MLFFLPAFGTIFLLDLADSIQGSKRKRTADQQSWKYTHQDVEQNKTQERAQYAVECQIDQSA